MCIEYSKGTPNLNPFLIFYFLSLSLFRLFSIFFLVLPFLNFFSFSSLPISFLLRRKPTIVTTIQKYGLKKLTLSELQLAI